MLCAPTAGDIVAARGPDPPLPTGANLDIWKEIAGLAVEYWKQVSSHPQISADFTAIAQRNAERVAAVAKASSEALLHAVAARFAAMSAPISGTQEPQLNFQQLRVLAPWAAVLRPWQRMAWAMAVRPTRKRLRR